MVSLPYGDHNSYPWTLFYTSSYAPCHFSRTHSFNDNTTRAVAALHLSNNAKQSEIIKSYAFITFTNNKQTDEVNIIVNLLQLYLVQLVQPLCVFVSVGKVNIYISGRMWQQRQIYQRGIEYSYLKRMLEYRGH